MKALFVGLGSIGTRHLKNLSAICKKQGILLEAHALRSSMRALPEQTANLLEREFCKMSEITERYDLLFVTNPTNLHFETIRTLAEKADTLFIEKPLFESTEYSLAECGLENKAAYIACPMRYCGTFLRLKQELANRQVYSVRILCSSYLPEWRVGVDYRTVYSAIKAMGGGVSIDLIHEWDYLIELFGMPLESKNLQGNYSNLEIDSEDISIYIARYEQLLAEIHLDYFGRTYRRTAEFFTKEGTIMADFGAGTLTLASGETISCAEEVNERYLREMEYFLCFASGQCKNTNSPERALATLHIALAK